jgi:WD40 repeat protein
VGCLSRAEGMRLSVRDELRSHTPHAIPLILPARFGLLHACVETLQAYLRACCRSWSHTSMLPNTHKSLVRRMMATLINCVAEKTNAHSNYIRSVAFSPDGTKIVSGSNDRTIKVWDLVNWSRKDHWMFNHSIQRFVLLLLWLNKFSMKFPDDVLDLLIEACLKSR